MAFRSSPKRREVIDIVSYYSEGPRYYYSEGLCDMMHKDNPKTVQNNSIDQLIDPNLTFSTVSRSAPVEHVRHLFSKAKQRSIQVSPGGDYIADLASLAASQAKVVTTRYPALRLIPPVQTCITVMDDRVAAGTGVLKSDPVLVDFMTVVVKSFQPEIAEAGRSTG